MEMYFQNTTPSSYLYEDSIKLSATLAPALEIWGIWDWNSSIYFWIRQIIFWFSANATQERADG